MASRPNPDPLARFHPAVRAWFMATFGTPTRPQALGWPAIASGTSTLILAPTGSGKTLAAFLWCLDRLMFTAPPAAAGRCRVLYVSPLKALATDVERNLRGPLAGIAATAASMGIACHAPAIATRTGDTPQAERARFRRTPADILVTTPESLYLLLTSGARDALRSIDTVIVDEIHALVPTKRGAHLALSLERLSVLGARPPQRIGLSATQRPLDEVARFLGGAQSEVASGLPGSPRRATSRRRGTAVASATPEGPGEFTTAREALAYHPVAIVDAGRKKPLALRIEVPVDVPVEPSTDDDRTGGARRLDRDNESTGDMPTRPSIWAAIHPRLLTLIREHRSTLIFANSRRLAERLAGALNELAGETLVRSHHGSLARAQRTDVEDRLKAGTLRALVATSSLELGIDMGAIDLVIQIEAPPSVASGLQRIGRGGHQANAVSEGVIFPKFRGDLVACAAVARAMHEGSVEATRYPRNPLDVLAQQIVAMTAVDAWDVDALFATLRRAAPFAELSRSIFEGVLDMLSGRFPSDAFAELRPRVTWDRLRGTLVAREGARRVAIANGGTIPDRGLYGVFLAGAVPNRPGAARVGELDEEMVFESRIGETFVLGASSWRIEDISHDRVLVSPAPGEPGKMPFWKGDRPGRPLELGLAIGALTHELLSTPTPAAIDRLTRLHDLDARAADVLLRYLCEQQTTAGAVPDASTVVVERVRDEFGDWRLCVLSPRGGRVHAPWAMAAAAHIRERTGTDVETLWGDDGFVVRFPDVDQPPDAGLLLPTASEAHALVVRQLGATALFAGKFRENAARALLLPKRRPGMRAPLWQQRKRAADLLAVAARFGSFPMLLETYRECLRDVFDMPALVATLTDIERGVIRTVTVDSTTPSPFAAALLYNYVATFLYDGDAPLAERRAQALAVDQAQLRELLGDADLRELLDASAMDTLERQLQRLDAAYQARSVDGVHDLLLSVGDLSTSEIAARTREVDAARTIRALVDTGRAVTGRVAGEDRHVAVEDAVRLRDGLGILLPPGIPEPLLTPVPDALGDLVLRYARTHAPFASAALARRLGLAPAVAEETLRRLTMQGRLIEGAFRPGGTQREWTEAGVLRVLRQRSLARLRKAVEPVEQAVLGRLATTWQGVVRRRCGADALLDAIEQLQGAPIAASVLETDVLPARVDGYEPADLDALAAAGEVVWVGLESLGDRDGRLALYLADQAALLRPPAPTAMSRREAVPLAGRARGRQVGAGAPPGRGDGILACLRAQGASFFGAVHAACGGGFPTETVDALWHLVWLGEITNDSFQALRAYTRTGMPPRQDRPRGTVGFRSRRLVPPASEGRWALAPRGVGTSTAWATALTRQLLARHGVLTREMAAAEAVPGGFAILYPVLKAMEESGTLRRGYFVEGLGATQFALPAALDLLRALRSPADSAEVVVLSATDPANVYGTVVKWARSSSADDAVSAARSPTRSVGATVILVDGAFAAYLARGDRQLTTALPADEPARSRVCRAAAQALIARAREGDDAPRGMLIEEIDGVPPGAHALAPALREAGFQPGAMGFRATFPRP